MFKAAGLDIDATALFDKVTCVCNFVGQEKVEEWNGSNHGRRLRRNWGDGPPKI